MISGGNFSPHAADGAPVEPSEEEDRLAYAVIGAAIAVHRGLGPGFSERVYENALCVELAERRIAFRRQVPVRITYRGIEVGDYVLDLLVGELLIVELKAVEALGEMHIGQVVSYLRATDLRLGLLLNFNVPTMRAGVRRVLKPR